MCRWSGNYVAEPSDHVWHEMNEEWCPANAMWKHCCEMATARAPAWVNVDLIERALAEEAKAIGKEEAPRVEVFALGCGTAPGENYSSAIFRVRATLAAGETRSLLVKVPPEAETIANAVIQGGLFRYETAMLAKHIPAMEALLESSCPGRFPPFAARCLLHGTSPAPFLVLDDLKPLGFRLAERRRGLNLRHCLLAIRTLARFHAASAALLKQNPSVASDFTNLLRQNASLYDALIRSFFQLPAAACKMWPGYQEYAGPLEEFAPKAMQAFADLHDPKPGRFNVLLHGDFWTNNLLFAYEDDILKDIRICDLQVTHIASPAIDLLYFLTSSLSDEVSKHHEDLLIREYHNELSDTMGLLGLTGPSLEELMEDIDAHGLFAYFGALGVWPLTRADIETDVNARLAEDSSDNGAALYQTPRVKQHLQRVLPELKRRGWMRF